MTPIKITCETCGKTHDVARTPEIPNNVISMGCNWCPECEDKAEDYYHEWYNKNDGDSDTLPEPDSPTQLVMPFILDEIEQNSILQLFNEGKQK